MYTENKIAIVSCGRTGTNMLLEILRGSDQLRASCPAENKTLFRNIRELPAGYLTKCDTVYIDNLWKVHDLIDMNPTIKILFPIRDLRDCAMSKIYRGQAGNDCPTVADDATYQGCLDDINWMHAIWEYIQSHDKSRHLAMLVKMEDVILDFDNTIQKVCEFCGIEFEKQTMLDFTSRYRIKHKADRYASIDKSQVGLYKRIDEVYDGFFRKHPIDMKALFSELEPYRKDFGYE